MNISFRPFSCYISDLFFLLEQLVIVNEHTIKWKSSLIRKWPDWSRSTGEEHQTGWGVQCGNVKLRVKVFTMRGKRERQQCSDYDNWMESLIKYLWIQFKFKICNFYQVTRYSKFLLRCLDKDTVGDNSAVPGLGTICPWHMISSWCSIFVWLHICLGKILNLSRRTARHGKWAESR